MIAVTRKFWKLWNEAFRRVDPSNNANYSSENTCKIDMAASLTSTAGASLRASTSSVCRCSMSAATQKSRQQRTFSSTAASSSASSIPQAGDKKASRLVNGSQGGSRLQRSASDPVKNARNQVSFSRLASIECAWSFAGSLIGRTCTTGKTADTTLSCFK